MHFVDPSFQTHLDDVIFADNFTNLIEERTENRVRYRSVKFIFTFKSRNIFATKSNTDTHKNYRKEETLFLTNGTMKRRQESTATIRSARDARVLSNDFHWLTNSVLQECYHWVAAQLWWLLHADGEHDEHSDLFLSRVRADWLEVEAREREKMAQRVHLTPHFVIQMTHFVSSSLRSFYAVVGFWFWHYGWNLSLLWGHEHAMPRVHRTRCIQWPRCLFVVNTFSPFSDGMTSRRSLKLPLMWSRRFLSRALWCARFSAWFGPLCRLLDDMSMSWLSTSSTLMLVLFKWSLNWSRSKSKDIVSRRKDHRKTVLSPKKTQVNHHHHRSFPCRFGWNSRRRTKPWARRLIFVSLFPTDLIGSCVFCSKWYKRSSTRVLTNTIVISMARRRKSSILLWLRRSVHWFPRWSVDWIAYFPDDQWSFDRCSNALSNYRESPWSSNHSFQSDSHTHSPE